MEVKNLSTGKTVVTLSEEEKEALLKAIERLGQTFQLTVLPAMQQLGEALRNAAPAIRRFNDAAASAREVCQRLDPAFSGPAEGPEPVRTIDPVTGQSRLEESFPIRRSPFPAPPRDGAGFIRPEDRRGA